MKINRWSMTISDKNAHGQLRDVLERDVIKFIPVYLAFYLIFTPINIYNLITGKELAQYFLLRNLFQIGSILICYLLTKRFRWVVIPFSIFVIYFIALNNLFLSYSDWLSEEDVSYHATISIFNLNISVISVVLILNCNYIATQYVIFPFYFMALLLQARMVQPQIQTKITILSVLIGAVFLFDNYRKCLQRAERIIHEIVIENQQAQLNSILNEQDAGLLIVEFEEGKNGVETLVASNNNDRLKVYSDQRQVKVHFSNSKMKEIMQATDLKNPLLQQVKQNDPESEINSNEEETIGINSLEQQLSSEKETRLRSIEDIIKKDLKQLNYSQTIFKLSKSNQSHQSCSNQNDQSPKNKYSKTTDEDMFVSFKSKKLFYNGNENCELIIMSDITTVLKFNDAQSNLELLKALQASVSHDMRAPLAAIIQTSKTLLNDITDQKYLSLIQPLHTASKMLQCQIMNLLDSSLLLRGQFEIKVDCFDVYKSIHEVASIIKDDAFLRNNEVQVFFESDVPQFILSDNNRLQQILLNLLTNSNKFTRNGLIKIVCKFKQEYQQIFIVVIDQGIGIDEQDVKKLFKPFHKLQKGAHLNPNGIGLGLSICKGILDKIGCDICVVSSKVQSFVGSREGHGTSIAFSMPLFIQKSNRAVKRSLKYKSSESEEENELLQPTSSESNKRSQQKAQQLKMEFQKRRKFNPKCKINSDLNLELEVIVESKDEDLDSFRKSSQTEEEKLHEMNLAEDKTFISPIPISVGVIHRHKNQSVATVAKEEFKFTKPFRLLIAEDTVIHRNNIRHILVEHFKIDESNIVFAEDGQKAQEVINSTLQTQISNNDHVEETDELRLDDGWEQSLTKGFDILILDYHMPHLSGLQVLQQIKPLYAQKEITLPKIIFLTAFTDSNLRQKCLKEGADYFLQKPIDRETIKQLFTDMALLDNV